MTNKTISDESWACRSEWPESKVSYAQLFALYERLKALENEVTKLKDRITQW